MESFQSLFYWITYSYAEASIEEMVRDVSFNPYFIGLPILITILGCVAQGQESVSILILLDYLFLYSDHPSYINYTR